MAEDTPSPHVTRWSPRPRRDYSWPPFKPGHELSKRHGAYSPRSWRPLADRIAAELVDVAPWAAEPTFAASVAAWARVEAQLQLVLDWLDEHGPLDDEGEPRGATNLQLKLESSAANLRATLGLDPQSWARLLASFAAAGDPADEGRRQLLEVGRRLLEAQEPQPSQIGGQDGQEQVALTDGEGDDA